MAKPTKSTKRPRPTKPTKPSKRPKPSKSTRSTKRPKPTKPSKPTKRPKRARPTRQAKRSEPTTQPKSTKPTKSTKPSKRDIPRKKPARTAETASASAQVNSAAEPDRATRIATVAADRAKLAGSDGGPVQLGSITVPSGTLAIFDIGLMGYLPREALDPMLICALVPSDRALAVVGTRVGKGRFSDCWDHVAIDLALAGPDRPEIARARKLGEAAVDFARLICMDRAAIDHWRHEDSLDQLADFVFWGRDAAALAKAIDAKRLSNSDGYGWANLPLAEAEAKADRAAQLKSENKWLLATDLRPHSHHFDALAAARASPSGAGVLEVGGARVLLFFTSWGDGVYPVYLDVDQDGRPVRIRIQLAPAESNAPPGAITHPPAW